jgi:hypothetical protein
MKPGATFSQYDKVIVADCLVQFKKGWQDNYNSENPGAPVSEQKVQEMKSLLATEFKKVFTKELQKGGYQVTAAPAPDVLLLRPAIVNVVINAPDVMAAGIDVNIVTSAGSGTFYLELRDSTTDTLLARAMDAEADQQPFARQGNVVTNMQAADFILTGWADELVKHLDAVRGQAPK